MLLPGANSYNLPPQVRALANPNDTYMNMPRGTISNGNEPQKNLMYTVPQGTQTQPGSDIPGTAAVTGQPQLQNRATIAPGGSMAQVQPQQAAQFALGAQQGIGSDGLQQFPPELARRVAGGLPPQVAALAGNNQYAAPDVTGVAQQVPPQQQAATGQGGNAGFTDPNVLGMPSGLMPGIPGFGGSTPPQWTQNSRPPITHTSGILDRPGSMNTNNGQLFRNR